METTYSVDELLEQAAVFARAGDYTAAVWRARLAVQSATDEESRTEAQLALERFEAMERAWRDRIEGLHLPFAKV